MSKILFLDIDGVLNSYDNMHAITLMWRQTNHVEKSMDEFGHLFDERCVRWLKYIVAQTGCDIVISSAWRRAGLDKMQAMWKLRELPGKVIDITPQYADAEMVELYAQVGADRGYEIQQWIDEHKPDTYCIVDDENDMLKHQMFVRTNPTIGLTLKDAEEIINILNT